MSKILIGAGPSSRGIHRLASFMRCPQLFAYEQLLKLDQGDRGPLVRGSIMHVGLAHHFARLQAKQQRTDPDRFYTVEDALVLSAKSFGEMGMHYLPIVARAVSAFIAQTIFTEFEVVHVEYEAKAYVSWPQEYINARPDRAGKKYLITQRFDHVFKDKSGKVWIEDHKSCAKIQGKTVTRYTLSSQFHLMQWFGQALYGDSFGGACINLIECPEHADQKAKSLQIQCDPAPFAVRQFPRNICDAEERIADLAAQGRDPWDYPQAVHEQVCHSPYGACSAFDLCRWGKSGL